MKQILHVQELSNNGDNNNRCSVSQNDKFTGYLSTHSNGPHLHSAQLIFNDE